MNHAPLEKGCKIDECVRKLMLEKNADNPLDGKNKLINMGANQKEVDAGKHCGKVQTDVFWTCYEKR